MKVQSRCYQRDVLIGEVQDLDVADGVRAVGRQAADVRNSDRSVGIEVDVGLPPEK